MKARVSYRASHSIKMEDVLLDFINLQEAAAFPVACSRIVTANFWNMEKEKLQVQTTMDLMPGRVTRSLSSLAPKDVSSTDFVARHLRPVLSFQSLLHIREDSLFFWGLGRG
jgi:hypothetical protein